jgi:dihydroorotate dehydrogenase electron transfer subunit
MEHNISVIPAKVVSNESLAKDTWELVLDPGDHFDVASIFPGQFVCFQPLDPDSAMSRPFSVSMISTSKGLFTVLYKVIGKNTKLMSQLTEGAVINFWGPLGKQRDLAFMQNYQKVWLVVGGIGIAPMIYFERMLTEILGADTRIFYGNQTKADIVPISTYAIDQTVDIATDDGSAGFYGFVTDLFKLEIAKESNKRILVLTCGPNIMMQRVSEICQQQGLDCYVMLERTMACGIGVCLGCSIETQAGMQKICEDGPIFKAEEVIWHELS